MIHIKNKNTSKEIIYKKSLKISKNVSIRNSYFHSPVSIGENSKIFNSNLKKYFICGNNNEITNSEFGAFCSIGNNVTTNAGKHPVNWVSTHLFKINSNAWKWYNKYKYKNIENDKFEWKKNNIFGNDVWIGNNAVILTGLKIPDGCIIGANSIINTDLPPYSIVQGVPGKIIRFRFKKNIIAKLLKLKWWEKSDEEINKINFKKYVDN